MEVRLALIIGRAAATTNRPRFCHLHRRRQTTPSPPASCRRKGGRQGSPATIKVTSLFGIGRRHEQPAEELAGDIAGDRSLCRRQAVAPEQPPADSRSSLRRHVAPESPQAMRASPRSDARASAVPSSRYVPRPNRQHRGEEADGGAAIGHIQVGPANRQTPPAASDTDADRCRGSCSTLTPSRRSASIITRVSSLSSTPVNSDSPTARAAQTSARLVMLFEPGGRIVARSGPVGRISTVSRFVMRVRRGFARNEWWWAQCLEGQYQ